MRFRARGALAAASLISVFTLTGCESPAPFAPLAGHTTGYTDERLSANRWRVTFVGNAVTSRRTVENYLLLRAAQVTQESGYRWFVFDTRDTQAHTAYYTAFQGWPGYHRRFGWYWQNWDYGDTYAVTRYEAYAEIVLLTPVQTRNEPRAVDAEDIIAHLTPPAPPPH